MEISREKSLELFSTLLESRRLEERLIQLFTAGAFSGWIHSGLGQEAVGVGVASALRTDDYIISTHRSRSVFLAKGISLKRFMAETFAKKDGTCKGRAGEMRFMDIEHGILAYSGVVGASIPFAVGVGLSCKLRGTDKIAVAHFGDGAVNTGSFHEAMNVASLWRLPVLFLCENNGWSQFTPQVATSSVLDVSKKAAAYNMPGETVDGNDVITVYKAAQSAIAHVREGNGPMLLECKTCRWLGHFVGDSQAYRDSKELEECRKSDPVAICQGRLLKEGVITPEIVGEMEKKIKADIDEAVEFAQKSPFPEPAEALEGVYA